MRSMATGMVVVREPEGKREADRAEREGRLQTPQDLWHAVYEGAVSRVRPKTMTTLTTFVALLPLLWAAGAGADTMRRLAAPMVGGLTTGYIGVMVVFPVVYYIAKRVALHRRFNPVCRR